MKTLSLLVCLLFLSMLAPPVAHAQTYTRGGQLSQSWSCALNNLAATLTECRALQTGQRNYITDVVVQTTTATSGTFAIQTGSGTNCGTGTAPLFPISGSGSDRFNAPITSQPFANVQLLTPLIPPVGAAICVIGIGTNTINIQLQGFTAP